MDDKFTAPTRDLHGAFFHGAHVVFSLGSFFVEDLAQLSPADDAYFGQRDRVAA